jgi:hypothetical protein
VGQFEDEESDDDENNAFLEQAVAEVKAQEPV